MAKEAMKLRWLHKIVRRIIRNSYPEVQVLENDLNWMLLRNDSINVRIHNSAKLYPPYHLYDVGVNRYTYISSNSQISLTTIGQFCSIGPNFVCGWGIHPTSGISTAPMFYSTRNQNGFSLSKEDKIDERKEIKIGNDVFIGANVTVLDGVSIGDGAVIGAGTVVSKDIPPYAVAVGCPIKIIRYRFDEKQIEDLKRIEWWNFSEEKLKDVERFFFDIDAFLEYERTPK